MKTKIGGLTASELRFTVPDELLHPLGTLETVVRNNVSKIVKKVAKVKGKKYGFYSSIGCKGKTRTIQATFTTEGGDKSTAKKEVKC